MAKYRTIRVYPDGYVWVVKKDGAAKASAIENTKEDAYKAARKIALNQGLVIIVHGKDGKIQKTVRPEEASDDGCFITTACVNYYGLDDNCSQLETLRQFRDKHLLKSSKDKLLVKEYYTIAPQLVRLLDKCPEMEKNKQFRIIFQKINDACYAIKSGKFEKAKKIYKGAVIHLLKHLKAH